PPYVNEQSMGTLPVEYLHEPRMALAGGEDGMDLIDTILKKAPEHLNEGGLLFCELGNERSYFEARYPDLPALWLEVSAGEDQVFMIRKEDLRF
ncbi:MAG: 50S ribosomal protein L3 N(5)-glutamine methyltransferase, partial [Limnobacter sp.]|nr:50S ribosomal protein L3 N(5)-glutamine methyltransferase [Limnobacter sp.]